MLALDFLKNKDTDNHLKYFIKKLVQHLHPKKDLKLQLYFQNKKSVNAGKGAVLSRYITVICNTTEISCAFLKCYTIPACTTNVPQLHSASSITNIFAASMCLSCFETEITAPNGVTQLRFNHYWVQTERYNCAYSTTMTTQVCVCDLVFNTKINKYSVIL